MPPQHRKLPALLGGLILMSAALVASLLAAPAQLHARPSFVRSCIGYCKHPTNAAKVFRWGSPAWDQEFETGSLSRHWKSNHPAMIGQRKGMLTVVAGQHTRSIAVWPDNQAARVGRWEARVRSREQSGSGKRFRYIWELVPADGNSHCGGSDIVLASYVPGDARVRGHVRTLPDNSFGYSRARDLRDRAWHTYAVEITAHRISWFVDTQVVRTETRPAALSGVKYRPELVMKGQRGVQMRPSWLQSDWVRYYSLARSDAKSTAAPLMQRTTFTHGC